MKALGVALVALSLLIQPARAWEAQDILDPTPADIEEILVNYPLDSLTVMEGCPEYGTDRAKPGCYQAEKRFVGRMGGATFTVSLAKCDTPDVGCQALLFEMWRRTTTRNRDLLDRVNEWNRTTWMVKVLGTPGWLRVMMHAPVKGGIPRETLEGYVRVWMSAAKRAASRFDEN